MRYLFAAGTALVILMNSNAIASAVPILIDPQVVAVGDYGIALGRHPSLTVVGSAYDKTGSGPPLTSISIGIFTYQFEIVGPPGLVSGQITAGGFIFGGDYGSANYSSLDSGFAVEGTAIGHVISTATQPPNLFTNEHWGFTQSYDFQANQPYTMAMFAGGEAFAGGGLFGPSFFSAVSAAELTIEDTRYTLDLSPGLTSVVPESSTWAMLLIGFALIALGRRWRSLRLALFALFISTGAQASTYTSGTLPPNRLCCF